MKGEFSGVIASFQNQAGKQGDMVDEERKLDLIALPTVRTVKHKGEKSHVPETPEDALAIYRDERSEDWERDYAARMIGSLEEGRAALLSTARNADEDEMLQQRAAEVLAWAWRDTGTLMTEDITGFTPAAREEIELHRRQG